VPTKLCISIRIFLPAFDGPDTSQIDDVKLEKSKHSCGNVG
jgi:hypothetical protein